MKNFGPLLYAVAVCTLAAAVFWPARPDEGPAPPEPRGNPGVLVLRQRAGAAVAEKTPAKVREGLCQLCRELGCNEPPDEEHNGRVKLVKVRVNRHPQVSLNDADADRILHDMSRVLNQSDAPGDVATPIQFVRDGAVQTLPASVPAVVQTSRQFSQVLSAAPGVKVVRGINWCGGTAAGIIGCAPLPSAQLSVCVVRFDPPLEGILWTHEYGHNCGLNHRTNDTRAIMYPSIDPQRRSVNAAESRAYLAGPAAATAGALMVPGCPQCDAGAPAARLVDVVRQHWIHGLPARAVQGFDAVDAADLVPLLVDPAPADEPFAPYVAAALCQLGDGDVVRHLIDFVQSDRASPEASRARHTILLGLGPLIERTGNRPAIEFLAQVASQPAAAAACVPAEAVAAAAKPGVTPPTPAELAQEYSVSAAIGLTRTQHPDAQARVQALQHAPAFAAAVDPR